MVTSTPREPLKKSGISGRRKRQEALTSIRKARKEDGYALRRNMAAVTKADTEVLARSDVLTQLTQRIQTLLTGVKHPERVTQMKSLRGFVLLMSSGVPPLFEPTDGQHESVWQVILSAIPAFISFLKVVEEREDPELQSMKRDAAFALRFICSMDRSAVVIDAGGIPPLSAVLLRYSLVEPEIAVQAAWCLGNIANESQEFAAQVRRQVAPSQLTALLQEPKIRRATVWLLRSFSNFCFEEATLVTLFQMVAELTAEVETLERAKARASSTMTPRISSWRQYEIQTGKPPPNDKAMVRVVDQSDPERVQVIDIDLNFVSGEYDTYCVASHLLVPLETLEDELPDDEDEDHEVELDERCLTISDALWIFVDGSREVESSSSHKVLMSFLMSRQFVPVLMKILHYGHILSSLATPTLRLLENMMSMSVNDEDTDDASPHPLVQECLEYGFLGACGQILNHRQKHLREEACWLLSNIIASSSGLTQFQALVDVLLEPSHTLLGQVAEQLSWAEYDVRREAIWVFSNLLNRISKSANRVSILRFPVFEAFARMLEEAADPEVVLLICETVEKILRHDHLTYQRVLEEVGLDEHLERLSLEEDTPASVSDLASMIVDTYFQGDLMGDERDESILPPAVVMNEAAGTSMFAFQSSGTPDGFHFNTPARDE